MGILLRNKAQYHESGLMETQRLREGPELGFHAGQALHTEPRLPSGWEKCLDLKSGLIYFKDWNSGTLTYRDPRHQSIQREGTQRISLLSISLSTTKENLQASCEGAVVTAKRKAETVDDDERSLELSLNLPGTSSHPRTSVSSQQDGSVCTVEKVRSALERLDRRSKSKSESAVSSPCSSDCFTSPSVMSFQGDEDEVQQPAECRDSGAKSQSASAAASRPSPSPVMITVGCKSCLMYVMLSKSNPCCPKCGNTDVLLELPVPAPKKRRLISVEAQSQIPSWSWCTA